jgi:NTE family protein
VSGLPVFLLSRPSRPVASFAGISIGSINVAIIAGHPPETRVDMLRTFWQTITGYLFGLSGDAGAWFARGDAPRGFFNQMSAGLALASGAPGFFNPRFPAPWLHPPGTIEATSYYDIRPLKPTLENLIDFERINGSDARLSLGAVNVRTGNLVYFDTTTHVIRPEHVMASGALPPGFPAVEIEGEYYWDGGLVSNTPLQWVATNRPPDTLAFQVDLWSARGEFPRTLAEVATRQKEIQYLSRTRAFTDLIKYLNKVHYSVGTASRAAAGGVQGERRGQISERRCTPSCPQHRAPHLPAEGLRERVQGLRILPAIHGRALARRL